MKKLIYLLRFLKQNKTPGEKLICYRLNISRATLYRQLRQARNILFMEINFEGKASREGGFKIKNYGLINKKAL